MTWVAAAVGAGIALLGASSSRQAASMQADAAARAQEFQAQQAAQAREDLQPWRQSGQEANNRLRQMMGFDGSGGGFSTNDPSYQFRLGEGLKAVDNSAAARGSTLSGATLKALQKYGQDSASQEFQNQFNRLTGMSGMGQNAAAGQGTTSMNFGNSSANNAMALGNANASGVMGVANAFSNGATQGINGWNQNQLMQMLRQPSGYYGGGSSTKATMYSNGGYGD